MCLCARGVALHACACVRGGGSTGVCTREMASHVCVRAWEWPHTCVRAWGGFAHVWQLPCPCAHAWGRLRVSVHV